MRRAGVVVAGFVAVSGVGCERCTPSDRDPRPRPPADSLVAIDSASAMRAASEALGTSDGGTYRLLTLTRDDSGAVLSLVPECPPPGACLGGGGRVRVGASGRATVLERFR